MTKYEKQLKILKAFDLNIGDTVKITLTRKRKNIFKIIESFEYEKQLALEYRGTSFSFNCLIEYEWVKITNKNYKNVVKKEKKGNDKL